MQTPESADHRSSFLRRRIMAVTACVLTSVFLVACGGGGAGGDGGRLDSATPNTENDDLGAESSSSSSVANDDIAANDDEITSSSSSSSSSNSSSADAGVDNDATGGDVSSSSSSSSSAPADDALNEVSGSVTLQWEVPEQRENGDYLELNEIGGYELRYRQAGSVDYETVLLDDGGRDSYEVGGLEGSYEFTIAAYDTNGLYSEFVALSPVTQ